MEMYQCISEVHTCQDVVNVGLFEKELRKEYNLYCTHLSHDSHWFVK
jgi:hypothetical protein